jgi:hypothetical protein
MYLEKQMLFDHIITPFMQPAIIDSIDFLCVLMTMLTVISNMKNYVLHLLMK